VSKIVITIGHDHDAENPCDTDGWKVYSFNRRHANYKSPNDFEDSEELREKLEAGLAFKLSYFEHGQCAWSLQGEGYECRWDSVDFAGLIIWETDSDDLGPKTYEDREKDARSFIEHYTQWCNGSCFWYSAVRMDDCSKCGQEEEIEDLDSCGGFIGHEYMFEHIQEMVDMAGQTIEFRGEASYLGDYYRKVVS